MCSPSQALSKGILALRRMCDVIVEGVYCVRERKRVRDRGPENEYKVMLHR